MEWVGWKERLRKRRDNGERESASGIRVSMGSDDVWTAMKDDTLPEPEKEDSLGTRGAVVSAMGSRRTKDPWWTSGVVFHEEGALCPICMQLEANVALNPCKHRMCSRCVSRLHTSACPACRMEIQEVFYCTENIFRPFSVVRAEQVTRESKALEATVQVLVLGPAKVGKKTLVNKLISTFPVYSEQERADFYLSGAMRSHAMSIEEFFASGLGSFSPNALVKNTAVRFVTYKLPSFDTSPAHKRSVLEIIEELRPDVLLMCSSCHRRTSLWHSVMWDRLLHTRLGNKPRIWCLLKYPGNDPLSPESVDRTDLYNAIKDLSMEDYPKGIFVASPKHVVSWGRIKSLAYSVVKYGRREHGLEDQNRVAPSDGRCLPFKWMNSRRKSQNLNTTLW